MKSRAFAVAALFLLAGCGGGGGGSSTPITTPPSGPNPMSSATLVMTFPLPTTTGSSTQRSPKFVSPNAASIKITINSINGNATLPAYVTPNPYIVSLSTTGGSPNCVAGVGTETCTITNVPAPVGSNVSYTFQVYDQAAAAGNLLTEATVLENVVQGIVNTFTITLNGVVSAIVLQNITTALTANTPVTATDVVRVNDASGARIVGTAAFDNGKTVAVVDNDTSGQTSLVAGSGGGSATVCADSLHCTLSHGADTVNLVYTGRAAATYPTDSFTVVATSASIPTQTSNLTITDNMMTVTNANIANDTSGDGNIDNGSPTLFFATTGGNAVVLATELGWTNSPYSQNLTYTSTTAGSGVGSTKSCAGIASISPASGSGVVSGNGVQYTITAVAPGVCDYVFADGVGQTYKLYVSVTNSTFNINSKNRNPQ